MPNTQFEVRSQAYSSVILPLARQERSMLWDTVVNKDKEQIKGKSFYQDQIGTWEMSPKTSVNAKTPMNDPNLSRTRVDMRTYNDARTIDRSLGLQSLSDPLSQASVCVQSAVGVQYDKLIYAALGGVTYRGETGSTSVSLPSAQKIAADFETSGTNTGLTTAKIRRASKMLDAKGVPSYDRYLVASATAKEQLLGTQAPTSSDYNAIRALVNGDINSWVGFRFIWLPDGIINVSSNIADYYAYHKTGMIFGDLDGMFLREQERPDLSYSKQIYYEITAGAGRLEEAKVVQIKGDESVIVNDVK